MAVDAQRITDVLAAAHRCLADGWTIITIPHRSKNPARFDWQKNRSTIVELEREVRSGRDNLGIVLGEPSGGLVDVDLDCREAIALARSFLPATRTFGRPSKPRSHLLYYCDGVKTKPFTDPRKNGKVERSDKAAMLVELLSTGRQCVAPPSLHDVTGELIAWDHGVLDRPARIDADELRRGVGKIAAGSLVARYYPCEGARHELALALAGAMAHAGWSLEQALEFLDPIVRVADDEEGSDRLRAVEDTYAKVKAGESTTGWPRVGEILGEDVVKRIRSYLDISGERRPHSADASDGWRTNLIYTMNKRGERQLRTVLANAVTILANDERWVGVVALDDFAHCVVKCSAPPWHADDAPCQPPATGDAWTDTDDGRLQSWLSREYDLHIGSEMATAAVQGVAERKLVHPVREYLDALKWDGANRLDSWLARYLGAVDGEYSRRVGRYWLIQAVARIFAPGCKADYVLVLEGAQGLRKSTALASLCPRPEWFSDTPIVLGTKDSYLAQNGRWIIELAELDSLLRSETSAAKAHFSSNADDYRPPYARRSRKIPRQCVYAGTINDGEYLRDATGNRRYWPVRCTRIDITDLTRDRDQLWAEAVVAYRAGERHYPEDPDELRLIVSEQEEREQVDAWEADIARWLRSQRRARVTVADIADQCLSIPIERCDRRVQMRVVNALKKLGCERKRESTGEREWFYAVPERVLCTGLDGPNPANGKIPDNLANLIRMQQRVPTSQPATPPSTTVGETQGRADEQSTR
jgi:predicted P-loop ATPase